MNLAYRTSVAGGGTSSTGNRSVTITTQAGDLLVVFCNASGNTNTAATCSDDQSGTYYRAAGVLKNTSTDCATAFIREQLVGTGASTIITVATGSNTAAEIVVVALTGSGLTGVAAMRQVATQANAAASATPSVTFTQALLTASMTLGSVNNGTTAGGVCTEPSGWSERQDAAQGSPTTGLEVVTRDSGSTATTITWGGISPTAFAAIMIELNTYEPRYGCMPYNGYSVF